MKVLKVLMLLILSLFVYLSLSHLLKLETPTIGAYWLAIFTIATFIVYFLVFFLDLKITTKWVSIKQRMNTLENKQKQLSKIVTALYKLHRISVALRDIKGASIKIAVLNAHIVDEIIHLLDRDEIDAFDKVLSNIIKNPN